MHLCHTVFTLYVNLRLFHSLISSYLVVHSTLNTLTALLITGYPFIFSNVSASCFAAVKPWTVASSSHEQRLSLLMVNRWPSNGQEQHNWTTWQKMAIFWYFLLLASVLHWSSACFLTVMQTGGGSVLIFLHYSDWSHKFTTSVFLTASNVIKCLHNRETFKFLSPYTKLLNYWRFSSIEWLNDTIAWTLGIYQILENVISSLSQDSRPSVWFIKCKQQQMCSDWSVWGC